MADLGQDIDASNEEVQIQPKKIKLFSIWLTAPRVGLRVFHKEKRHI